MTYTMPQNVTGSVDLLVWTNSTVGGWFGSMILFSFFIVTFMATNKGSTKTAFATASFVTAMVAIMMRAMDFVSDNAVITAIVMAGFAIMWLIVDRESR
jgi:hypothetical protein